MPDNYYEIKMLRLKMIYLLLGWTIILNIGTFLMLNIVHCPTLFIIVFTLLLLYILIFSGWIPLKIGQIWGISNIFIIASALPIMFYLSSVFSADMKSANIGESIGWNIIYFLIIWGMISVYQIFIFLPLFMIGYCFRTTHFKIKINYLSLPQDINAFISLLNLIPIGGIISFVILIVVSLVMLILHPGPL